MKNFKFEIENLKFLTVLWGDPESHILSEHKPRLRVESRYCAEDNHGDGDENPLEREDEIVES